MSKIRVAVVGCGALAKLTHLKHCQMDEDIILQVVCDTDLENLNYCQKQFGAVRAESDWRKVVNARDVDLCVLATHQTFRGEFIIPALRAGKPVYTEKPLAPDVDEMMEILKVTRETKVPVCVGHNRRNSPAMLEFKRLVEKAKAERDGALGQTVTNYVGARSRIPEENAMQFFMRINDDSRSWKNWVFWDRQGIMFGEMVHFIDIALWMNDAKPVRAFAEGSPRGNFTLLLRFNDGSLTTMVHSMVGNFDYPKELFEFSANYYTVTMDQHFEVKQSGFPDEESVRTFPYAVDWANRHKGMSGYFQARDEELARAKKEGDAVRWLNVEKGHYSHLKRFIAHVQGKGENPCPVDTAIGVNKIALKFLESAKLGLPVAINPEDWHLPD